MRVRNVGLRLIAIMNNNTGAMTNEQEIEKQVPD